MRTPAKLGIFALGAALIFGGAYGIGQAAGPVGAAPDTARPGHGGEHGAASAPASGELPAGGLMVAQDGYRLDLLSGDAEAGAREESPSGSWARTGRRSPRSPPPTTSGCT